MSLDEIRHAINNNPNTSNYIEYDEWEKHTAQIEKELLSLVPEKKKTHTKTSKAFQETYTIKTIPNQHAFGYNQAIDDITKQIKEWVKT